MTPHKLAVVLGTRPEIIKLATIVKLLGPAARVIHTRQHYDSNLSDVFFEQLGIPAPDLRLDVGGRSRAEQIAATISGLDPVFAAEVPDVVIVQGDTNTTLGAALAANGRNINLVHIEAGLRSFDRAMPEEHNRVLTDHLADLCCAPTDVGKSNLATEGIGGDRVVVTGNTIVEAVHALLPGESARLSLLASLGLEPSEFVLTTLHRPENVDNAEPLAAILEELSGLPLRVVLPLHPRSRRRIAEFGLDSLLDAISVIDPLGYEEFLALSAEAAFLVSDSGGIQEEASILKRPVIVVRNSTERPEVLDTFATLVEPGPKIGSTGRGWLEDLDKVHARLADLPTPYGDGSASRRSIEAMTTRFGLG